MKKLIAANWKMNKTGAEAVSFLKEFKPLVKDANADIVVCPSFTSLQDAAKEAKGSNVHIGAQNMHFEDSGAFTGDISPLMLKDFCEYAIIGHSERREFFKEDDQMINKKLISALKHGFKAILCVGETWEQRSNNQTEDVLEDQLVKGLDGIKDTANLTVAYEPVWAISRGNPNQKAATKDDAEQAHVFIRKVLAGIFDEDTAKKIRILYGGSMKPENAKELLAMKNIDGGLVGNASLNAKSFAEVVKAAQ
ncbi:MAG TPA: triose-phosphate isomerase [Candidatus Nanoarchaeia archaeon]|nr:triose-phosphate isomerase [Candidatus Nanoarchaeia archaeon]